MVNFDPAKGGGMWLNSIKQSIWDKIFNLFPLLL